MKPVTEEQKERFSLTILFSVIVLVFLILTTIIVSIILSVMVYRGKLEIGDIKLSAGRFILDMLLWSTGIGALITLLTMRYPLKPVNRFLNVLDRLAHGDFSARLSFTGPFSSVPAVKEVADGVNLMAAELEQTEILREDFINNFSHEFKTPIVSIAGFAKMLKHGDLTEEQQREYLDIIEEESLRLAQMSTNVLNLTRVENQSILTDVQTFNLSEQIRTCVLVLEEKWTRKNIEIKLPEEEYMISGSPELLKQVWINLLDNAIKFSADYSPVEVKIRQNEDGTTVKISNFCEDIPAEKLSKLFNKFYQADESHAAEGSGVGLAVVRKVVSLHNGTVTVTSQNGKTKQQIHTRQQIYLNINGGLLSSIWHFLYMQSTFVSAHV